MTNVIHPFHLLVIALSGWLNRHQQAVIDYLIAENRMLKEQLEGQRLRFTEEQRIGLAAKTKVLGHRRLEEIETFVTPDTLLAWQRKQVLLRSRPSSVDRTGRVIVLMQGPYDSRGKKVNEVNMYDVL
jgi:hypothetical protein